MTTEGSTPDPRTTPLPKWTAKAGHDGFLPIGILIAPNGNRYTVVSEAEARSMARTLNAGPAADALAEAVEQGWDEDNALNTPEINAALAAYRKASEEPE